MSYTSRIQQLNILLEVCEDNKSPSDVVLVCRNVLEKALDIILDYQNVRKPVNASLLELINNEAVANFFGTDVLLDSLHFVRIVGINALHNKHIKRTQAQVAYANTEFLLKVISEKIDGQTQSVQPQLVTNKPPLPKHKALSEAETRKIYIDLYLGEAGWEVVKPNTETTLSNGKKVECGTVNPGKASEEIKVEGLPTKSGVGFCDYVLYHKDGKPLAIVEAKRTSVDATVGQQQVIEYGRCMKAVYGYTPVLYYTNGYDIYMIDGKYPARKVAGFRTHDELEYIIQNRNIKQIADISVDASIAGRPYQNIAITNICDRLNQMQRRGLVVMATGTGKTRTAIALVELLTRNNWVKNVLFLADRTSLVRQAFKSFQALLPNMTYAVVSDKSLADEPNARITFSTHQTMINCIDKDDKDFTCGRFDLIIIDEAHRSIFNKYGAIFNYFDSLLVGLTATPKDEVDANTYAIFDCESGIPNFSYSLEEAVKDHYLVPYRTINRSTNLLENGMTFKDLSQNDQAQLMLLDDEDYQDDTVISGKKLFQKIYNKDTCRRVLDDLMNMGLRVEQGQVLGKTIIFAVNHFHAQLIVDTFNKMYPQYPNYCKLIDNQVKHSEHLIDEFGSDPEFRIAVSVDMLDTGIDVPSVLNLVFFKRVRSNIKLIQMVGRGTRLCPELIDGEDKKEFLIFDYFENFENVSLDGVKQPVTITQKLFEIRLNMMCEMQTAAHQVIDDHKQYYQVLKDILMKQVEYIKTNGSERVSVRAVMGIVDKFNDEYRWQYISALDKKEMIYALKPLVESDIKEDYLSLSFDYQMLQIEDILIKTASIDDAVHIIKKMRLVAQTLLNQATIGDIADKIDVLNEVYNGDAWVNPTLTSLEYYRKELRHLMKYLRHHVISGVIIDHPDQIIDLGEDTTMLDIRTYKEKIMDYLYDNIDNPTIQKIKNIEKLSDADFDYLEDILWVKLGSKDDYFSISKIDNLAAFIRTIVGIDQEAINNKFSAYLNENVLTGEQKEFIYSVIDYVRENGDIEGNELTSEYPFKAYHLVDLFDNKLPVLADVVNTLHNCILH